MHLDDLNKEQQRAVRASKGNQLVLAGAGSGKTRVLVHRLAWLIQAKKISPNSVLAVTFTNKAAREMRGRVERILNRPITGMWIGTFHSIAHRLLRLHYKEARLNPNFRIIDSADQKNLIKRVLKEMKMDEKRWAPGLIQYHINQWKEEGLRSQHISANDFMQENILAIYIAYERITQEEGLVDFAELLLRAYEIFSRNEELTQHYRKKFRHILIDEFQDTNRIQCVFIQMLKDKNNQIMAVGDEDQSIYGWRGARIDNILNFDKIFPDTRTYMLEQNYRSSEYILQAANSIISHNKQRKGKKLWTAITKNELLQLYRALDDKSEAFFIAETLQEHQRKRGRLSNCAVFYRTNAQSRLIEEQLVAFALPYKVYGGLRFYDRAEVKHVLAYMRLLVNRHDYQSFLRIINMPRRGLGSMTTTKIDQLAETHQLSLWQAAEKFLTENALTTQIANSLTGFMELIESMEEATAQLPLKYKVAHIIRQSGLKAYYELSKDPNHNACLDNIVELINAAALAYPGRADKEVMREFLNNITLESRSEQANENQDAVQLMTLHAAKGLEFPIVFMTGMEESLFPMESSTGNPDLLEEERRLCYVGITRAREKLYFSCAEVRRLHGHPTYNPVSRFIEEIPTKLVHEMGRTQPPLNTLVVRTGQQVMHKIFGYGVVKRVEGRGEFSRIEVDFETEGNKWFIPHYAKELQLLENNR